MKTPWSDLLRYGITITTITVITISAVCLLTILGIVVLITKALVFIR